MKIEKLRLRGFHGVRRGLGLDEIEIDFTGVEGLVAFDGMNGAGKSTVLELLSPYNQLASRDGALHRHVYTRDAEKEFVFSYQGNHYRTLLKIDSESEKSEGYIWVNGNPAVNGKISSYARYMRDLFGSPELFYNSVFCAQNSSKLSDLTTGQLKTLFAEFLRLDRLTGYENTARQCAMIVGAKAAQADARIAALSDRMTGKDAIVMDIAIAEMQLRDCGGQKQTLTTQILALQEQAAALKDAVAVHNVLTQRKADVAANIAELSRELIAEEATMQAGIDALKVKYKEAAIEGARCAVVIEMADAIASAAAKEDAESLVVADKSAEIDRLSMQVSQRQTAIQDLEDRKRVFSSLLLEQSNDPKLRALSDAITQAKTDLSALAQEARNIDADRETIDLTHKIAAHKERMLGLTCRDPRCPEDANTCSYIAGAIASRDALPLAEQALAERTAMLDVQRTDITEKMVVLREKIAETTAQHSELATHNENEKTKISANISMLDKAIQVERSTLVQLQDCMNSARQSLAAARLELVKLKELTEKKAELQIAIARKEAIDVRLTELTKEGLLARQAWAEKAHEKEARIDEYRTTLSGIDLQMDREAPEKLNSVMAQIDSANRMASALEPTISELGNGLAQKRAELVQIEAIGKELEEAKAERDNLTRTQSEWTYLRNACGKSGLQALEIDGAAPIITGYANDLLSMAFGPLFSVKFRTQDDEGREVLDIVTIGENGDEILLENLSGGQRIWILMALRLAMTLLSKEKSGRTFQTAFSDESDGALDQENAVNYVAMYRSFMQTGRFENFFFISHKAECRNIADKILAFEYGKNPAWR